MGRGEETGLRIDQRNWRRKRTIAGRGPLTTRAPYKVFGRLHEDPIRARRRQAYEKRQWTKSREAARLQCGGLYEGLIRTPTLMRTTIASRAEIDGTSKRVMPSPFWNRLAPHTTRACWHGSWV